MDQVPVRRRNRGVRRYYATALTLLFVGSFSAITLWVSGFDPVAWWTDWQNHRSANTAKPVPSRRVTGPISVVHPRPLGTDSSISKVPLPLILTATRPGRNAREGFADIGVNELSPQTYKAGALLANGARIEEIYRNYVVLERGGRKARLYIQGRGPASEQAALAALLTVGGTQSKTVAVADSREELTDYIRLSPVYDGKSLHALEVYSTAHSDVFERLGLKPGDRITAINDAPVVESKAAFGALRQLANGAALRVTVERDGLLRTLSLDGAILLASRRANNKDQGIVQ